MVVINLDYSVRVDLSLMQLMWGKSLFLNAIGCLGQRDYRIFFKALVSTSETRLCRNFLFVVSAALDLRSPIGYSEYCTQLLFKDWIFAFVQSL